MRNPDSHPLIPVVPSVQDGVRTTKDETDSLGTVLDGVESPVVQSVLDGVRTTKDENVSSLDGLDGAKAVD